MDNYVIRGVGHNTAFLRDVYVNKRFEEGRLTTNFLPEEYPDGFHGVELTTERKERMAAIGAIMRSTA